MSFWYNKKEGEKVASLSVSNWAEVNSKARFLEFGFISDDTFYLMVGQALSFTGINKMGEKDFQLANELVQFKVARKNHVKKDWKTKADVSVEQTRLERWLCKVLDGLDADKRYQGKLELSDAGILEMIISGKDATGQEIPKATLDMLESGVLDISEIDEKLVTSELLAIPTYKSGNYSKGQTEAEKIKDRFNFLNEQVKGLWDIEDDKNPVEFLTNALMKADEKAVYFLQVIDKLIS